MICGKEKKPAATKENGKEAELWEIKAEKAAAEIYLAVDSDQRVHICGHEEDPIQISKLLEEAHLQKKPGT